MAVLRVSRALAARNAGLLSSRVEKTGAMSETRPKILVTHPEIRPEALDLLSSDCDVTICQSIPPSRKEILEKCPGVDALYWIGHEPLNAEILDAVGPQLKSVSTTSAGIDFVDVSEFKKRGIPLGNTPTVLNFAVADVAIGLMIAAARRFHEGRLKIENSDWQSSLVHWMWGQEIRDAKVGFLGFGGIAQEIAKRLKGFDIDEILYNTRRPVAKDVEKEFCARHVNFDTMVSESDIVFIVAPLTAETKEIFNANAFKKMKPNAVLVNVARGQLVNQTDLYNALKNKQIFAAGLDVMTPEPLPSNDPLLTLPNCVIIPHLGSATQRTRTEMGIIAAHNVLRGLVGEPMFAPAY